MQIGILGGGRVGVSLARRWTAAGHDVTISTRDTIAETAADKDVVLLAVPAAAVGEVLAAAGALEGTVVIDATNNLSGGPDGAAIAAMASRAHVVKAFNTVGNTFISGPIQVLNYSYFDKEFPETFRTAMQIRESIEKHGWKKVVAFQTRNPMHRAHEELVRMAMDREKADGAVIHMLLGKLKPGDIPADVRDAAIRKMVELYFPPNTVEITGYGFDMLYAGPREAVLHAVFRQNMGATHLIVGRDHAGVGSYYGPFDAHHIFDEIPEDSLETRPLKIDWTFWCYKCGGMASARTCPHDDADRLLVSGTKLRKWLSEGAEVPAEFSRPEVLAILREYYEGLAAHERVEVKLSGHSAR